jgi:DMSO/TMAO reductase YedYZ molybdopterin-dependent catalytic subunit
VVRIARSLKPEEYFTSTVRSTWAAAWLGMALGVAFSVCFLTGALSHYIQHPPAWFEWPPRPAGLYRVTQGVHVATGIATIPLLLAKLWTVYPMLWRWPPADSLARVVERVALVPLVAGSLFLLVSGVNNIALWYPWEFFFPTAHWWAAWLTLGALVAHVGSKIYTARDAIRSPSEHAEPTAPGALSRRGFLTTVAGASATLTLVTVGQTFRPLSPLAVLAPRRPDVGPQGFPVNKSAREARVLDLATDPTWRLSVEGAVERPLSLGLVELRALPQRDATLPISCVEGWSASVRWRGVALRDLLELAGASPGAEVSAESLQPTGLYRRSRVNSRQARDRDCLVALGCNGETLDLNHGFPARLIGPNRPGVQQTKWLTRLVVS